MKKNSIFSIIFLLSLFLSCKKNTKKEYSYQPQFYTKLDIMNINTVTLIKYKRSHEINKKEIGFVYKYKVLDFPLAPNSTAWHFVLKDSFTVGYNYELIFKSKTKTYLYSIKNIIYDSIPTGKSYIYTVKYYYINSKPHSKINPVFYIDE